MTRRQAEKKLRAYFGVGASKRVNIVVAEGSEGVEIWGISLGRGLCYRACYGDINELGNKWWRGRKYRHDRWEIRVGSITLDKMMGVDHELATYEMEVA